MMSKADFYWIFMVVVPKHQMGFIFEVFLFLGLLPQFICHPVFSSFLGMMMVMDSNYPQDVSQALLHFYVALGSMPHLYS